MNFTLQADEVILYEGEVRSKDYDGSLILTLTSQKFVIEQETGILKKVREMIQEINLSDVKIYNGTAQVKQRGSNVDIQTIPKNFTFEFSSLLEARKFTSKIIDTVTESTVAKRVSDKTKNAFELVDDTLGLDTRGTIKNVLEQGLVGTVFKGIGKKKK